MIVFQAWENTTVLVRLQHLFEQNEHPTLSQPAHVHLGQFLASLLGVVQEHIYLHVRALNAVSPAPEGGGCTLTGLTATLSPLGICTILVDIQ